MEVTKVEAIETVIDIARSNSLTAEDFVRIQKELNLAPKKSQVLETSLLYLGGALLFAGIAVFAGMHWNELNDFSRIVITLGAGIVCYVLAWIYGQSRVSTALFLMAGALEPTGMMIAADQYSIFSSDGERFSLVAIFGIMLVQFVLTFQIRKLPILLNGALAFGSLFYWSAYLWLTDFTNIQHSEIYGMVYGLTFMAIIYGLTPLFHSIVVKELWFAFTALILYFSSYAYFKGSFTEILYVLILVATLVLGNFTQSMLLSLMSIAALLFYSGDLSHRVFPDALSWPITLFLLGLGCFWLRGKWLSLQK